MSEQPEDKDPNQALAIQPAWRCLVEDRLERLADWVRTWPPGSSVDIYGVPTLVDSQLGDEVLSAAATSAGDYAAARTRAYKSPVSTGFDRTLERAIRQRVVGVLEKRATVAAPGYPVSRAHVEGCRRSDRCECFDYIEFIASQARSLDDELASDIIAGAVRKAHNGAFSQAVDPAALAATAFRTLRSDAERKRRRRWTHEGGTESELEYVLSTAGSDGVADLLASLLPDCPADGPAPDWAECWTFLDARQWLNSTALGRHVWNCIEGGLVSLPSVVFREDRDAFVAVCATAVATYYTAAGGRAGEIEELLRMCLRRAVGGDVASGGRGQRAARTARVLVSFVESLAFSPIAKIA